MIDTIVNSFDIWTDAKGLKSQLRLKTVDNISLEGIENLRNLILGLSLSGKFTENKIKHSSTIKQDIAKAKTSYFKSIGKNPKDIEFGPPLLKEFDLPEGWPWMRIGELCDLQTGATPSTLKPDYYGGEIRWLVSGDINKGIIYDCDGRITNEGLKNSNCKILPKDTVLIALNGQGKTRASVALLKVEAACNQSLVGIIPYTSNILDSKFLMLSLHYRYYEIREITGQKQRRGLNMGLVNELSIPFPPLKEQHRIVAKVDELMALCDNLAEEQFNNLKTHQALVKTLLDTLTHATDANELQEAWERMSAHFDTLFCTDDSIDQLKQTILQLAVMGKLVKQDPNDESASELMKKIAKEKERLIEEGKLKKTAPLAVIFENEKAFLLPKGWEWKRLNDVIDVRDGTHDSPKEAFGDYTYPLITSQNFENGSINFDTAKRISEADHIEISKRSLVERFDILFSMIGGNLGNQVMVNTDRPFSVKNVALFKYYSKEHTSPYFIKKIMEFIALTLQSRAIGGAQPFVSLGFLRNIVVALPPIAEQNRIVEKINVLFTLCEFLKEKIKKSQEIKILLSKTIVEKAVQ